MGHFGKNSETFGMNSVLGRSERNRKPSETLRSWDIRKEFGSKVHIEFGNSRNQNSFRTLSLLFRMFSKNSPYLSETFPFFPLGHRRAVAFKMLEEKINGLTLLTDAVMEFLYDDGTVSQDAINKENEEADSYRGKFLMAKVTYENALAGVASTSRAASTYGEWSNCQQRTKHSAGEEDWKCRPLNW